MPRKISDQTRRRIIEALNYMKNAAPCATIANISKALNITWTQARHLIEQLVKNSMLIEISVGGKLLWCLNEQAAATEIYALKRALWHVICANKRRFVTPSTTIKLLAEDSSARKIYAKYVDITTVNGGALNFVSAILEDLLGPPLDNGQPNKKYKRKVIYYVPPRLCDQEPRPQEALIRRYKQPRTLVNFRISRAMYNDIIQAANYMGVSVPDLIRMAIARLISQYSHLLCDNRGADLKAN
jgi:predicted transcriptional regulator